MKKIENNIMIILLIRSIFLLIFSKITLTNLILGIFIGFILIFLYQKLPLKKYNWFQLILLIVFIIISIYLIYNVTYFIKENIIKSYSLSIIIISFVVVCLYITKKGYHTYIKIMELSSYILITYFIISLMLLIPYIKIINFQNINLTINNDFLTLSFFLLLIFIAINYLNDCKLNYRSYLISSSNIIFLKLFIISILSQTLENVFRYSYVSIFKKISYFSFFERLEGILALQYLFDYLFLCILFMLVIKKLIYNLFPKKLFKYAINK